MTDFERCIMCGKITDVPRDMPIYKRIGYMDGSGQLCLECYRKINFPDEHDRIVMQNLTSIVVNMSREKSQDIGG